MDTQKVFYSRYQQYMKVLSLTSNITFFSTRKIDAITNNFLKIMFVPGTLTDKYCRKTNKYH